MKIIFVQKLSLFLIGTASISAFIKSKGHDCDVLLAGEEKNLINKLKALSPDIIGFSCTTGEHNWVLEVAKKIKKVMDIPIILGGPHPTFFPEIINDSNIDIICIGEGEHATLELLNKMEKKEDIKNIKNLWVKKNNKIFKNSLRPFIQNLDELPYPDRKIYYKYKFLRELNLKNFISGRGCPYNCTFCFNHALKQIYNNKGTYIRKRSVDNLIKEILEVKEKYGMNHITFSDDTFILNRTWLRQFLLEYKKRVNLPFSCNIRANLIDEEIVKLLKEANCYVAAMGIESGDENIRNNILKKGITNEQIRNTARLFKKYKIRFKTFNMIALPEESFEETFKNMKLNIEIKPTIATCSILQPYPKLEVTEYCMKHGFLDSNYCVSDFGISRSDKSLTPLKIRDKEKFENLQAFYSLVIQFPFLKSIVKSLINFPPNKVFKLIEKLTYGSLSMRLYKFGIKDSMNLALKSGYL